MNKHDEIAPQLPTVPVAEAAHDRSIAAPTPSRHLARLLQHALPESEPNIHAFTAIATDMIRRLAPQDPIEEMLVTQMIATHLRGIGLARRAMIQKDRQWLDTLQTHSDRALNLFRRQMQALADYRRPRNSSFTAIRQTNIAGQQVVAIHAPNLGPDRPLSIPEDTHEPRLHAPTQAEVQAHPRRPAVASDVDPKP